MSAVQIYNNPQVTFKTETFITLAIIAWTYLFHAYYRENKIDYRYFQMKGKKKIYSRTTHGAYKHWELERCINDKASPIDQATKQNLLFLIGLRHEIEHQMTRRIDSEVSAKIQACSINYNFYIKKLFGNQLGVDKELGMAIQFSPIEAEQKAELFHNEKMVTNIHNFISTFENELAEEDFNNSHYAYRIVFTRVDGKRVNGTTDEVISFIPANSPMAKGLNAQYAFYTETEKKKYLAKDIVDMMRNKGYKWFSIPIMTDYWKNNLKSREEYGIYITKHQWMWYENWIQVIEAFCKKNDKKYRSNE